MFNMDHETITRPSLSLGTLRSQCWNKLKVDTGATTLCSSIMDRYKTSTYKQDPGIHVVTGASNDNERNMYVTVQRLGAWLYYRRREETRK